MARLKNFGPDSFIPAILVATSDNVEYLSPL